MFDGGCREPTLMWWPGTIPAGSHCREPAMTIDVLPTVAHLVGASLPPHKIDGKNILPLIQGKDGATSPHEAYYFYYGKQLQAMRMGKWKLHFPHNYRSLEGRPGGTGGTPTQYNNRVKIGLSLFDLEADVGETTDVQEQHPQVMSRMQQLASAMRAELGDVKRTGSGQRVPGRIRQ